jgi:hypothetical protein
MDDDKKHKNKNLGTKYTYYPSYKIPDNYDKNCIKYACAASDLVPKKQLAINPSHFAKFTLTSYMENFHLIISQYFNVIS